MFTSSNYREQYTLILFGKIVLWAVCLMKDQDISLMLLISLKY